MTNDKRSKKRKKEKRKREKDRKKTKNKYDIQCRPLNRITLVQRKSDNNNQMIQLNAVFLYCLGIMGSVICDYNKLLILLSMI